MDRSWAEATAWLQKIMVRQKKTCLDRAGTNNGNTEDKMDSIDNINITAIGASGSGKTCFLLGMNYVMSAGVKGYTLTTADDEVAAELRKKWDKINEGQAFPHFPPGTDQMVDITFNLEYTYQKIRSFRWMDYKGGLVDEFEPENQEEYEALVNRVKISECLFIFVDGDVLCTLDKKVMLQDVKARCSSKINKFISKYIEFVGRKKNLPPVAIVVTKFDKCKNYVNTDQLEEVIKEAFSPLFSYDGNENDVTIIPVSLGIDTENRDRVGILQPINIYKPLFFGIYHPLKRECDEFSEKRDKLRNMVAVSQEAYNKRFSFKGKKKRGKELEMLKAELRELEATVARYEKSVEKISSELKGLSVFNQGATRIWG